MNVLRLKKLEMKTIDIVREAGELILKRWNNVGEISYKNQRDIATAVDIETENFLRTKLSNIFPDAGFIVEEGHSQQKKTYNWVIDPIDGTKNYAYSMPVFVSQVALAKDGKPILGIIYNPVSKQMFSASLGNGSFLNNKKLKLNARFEEDKAIIDIDFGGHDNFFDWKCTVFKAFARSFFRARIFGGIFTIYVLTGALDAYVALDKKTKIVDIMPNIIIAQEAGLKAEHIIVRPDLKTLIIAHPKLFESIKKTLINSLS